MDSHGFPGGASHDPDAFLTARDVMTRYHVSRNTVYTGPLRALAISVGRGKGLRWPCSRLMAYENGQSHTEGRAIEGGV
jgi:hypothetical protein